ncbi:M20/M25/M40 family metallo-hydrolase [Peptacetobacter hominis]|uniref:M20/M25/M40 family metallo-hydrolase n=1 Tax=Peptacetobacter hominis TaxID=2743610 RepID=A0A544QV15_9FIRM|nr:M20/M25/M40 family metallo-hydrolase [Peptacetobacter hominis]TQQ84517.1 M20/M25/M40 family metallo-hydrolase [Peptacetobacter hominis]
MDILSIFLDLVKLSSPSKNERCVADYIKKSLSYYKDYLDIYEDNAGILIDGNCGNIIVKIDGQGEPIAFDAHMDTVEPCNAINPIIKDSIIYTNGNSILGADDKSGIAVMISIIHEIIEKKLPHPPLTFVFSVCEEKSLQGAKNLDLNIFEDHKYVFVLDGEGDVGSMILKTPYGCKGTLKVIGKEAHAGVCPENGINALCVASEAITSLNFGRINENTTSNIGVISGGTATNVVMGSVEMKFEARSYLKDELISLIENVKNTFKEICLSNGASFEEDLKYGTPGYNISEDDEIVKDFKKACSNLNLKFNPLSCGGGCNANVYRKNGINAVNLGLNMKNVHSTKEHISIEDLEKAKALCLELIKILSD